MSKPTNQSNSTQDTDRALIRELVNALEKARDRFNEYAREHQRKAEMPGGFYDHERDARMEKADRNLDMALLCDRAIAKAKAKQ